MIEYPTAEERRAEAKRLLDGLSGQWVADRMTDDEHHVSKATVRLWRRGDRIPDLEDLLRLADATQRPLSPLLRARIFGGAEPGKEGRQEASG